ncbi:MAG: sulfur carrier protein ThiS [Candidatus Sulfotelmatobacter sp.]|jgi:sulfur carrier protein
MSVIVNGQALPLSEPETIASLLLILAPLPPFAVARNEEFVPRTAYAECRIYPGDRIDIVHPTVGG